MSFLDTCIKRMGSISILRLGRKILNPRVAEPDPHYFWKLDSDPFSHSETLEAQNRAVDAHGLEAQNGGSIL